MLAFKGITLELIICGTGNLESFLQTPVEYWFPFLIRGSDVGGRIGTGFTRVWRDVGKDLKYRDIEQDLGRGGRVVKGNGL